MELRIYWMVPSVKGRGGQDHSMYNHHYYKLCTVGSRVIHRELVYDDVRAEKVVKTLDSG